MGKTGSLGVCCSMAQSFSQLILSRLLLSSQRVMLHTAVTSKSSYVEPGMPNLGLEMGPSTLKWPFRVYCLLCENSRYYVGLAPKDDIKDRLEKHFQGKACHFTTFFPAKKILLLQAAPDTAAEAYLYYAMVAQKEKIADNGHIIPAVGGWTQTSSNPSPLSSLLIKESKWMLGSYCTRCGSQQHRSHKCKNAPATCWYECKNKDCGKKMFLTSRGFTPSSAKTSLKGDVDSKPPPSSPPQTSSISSSSGTKRKMPQQQQQQQHPSVKRVQISGTAYTSLGWYVGRPNVAQSLFKKARTHCAPHAVELRHGDYKTLMAQGFVQQGQGRCKELLESDGRRLPKHWTDTECCSEAVV